MLSRFPALDGLRALAVTMVFLDHFGGGAHGGLALRLLDVVRRHLWTGVDLFFVLSGFLITGILYDTRDDSRYFFRFYARRSLRIFPVFYLLAALLVALTPVFAFQWRPLQLTFLAYIGNFFANHDFALYQVPSARHAAATVFIGHLWSLCVEEQFYLLWPLAVWLIRDRRKLIATALGLSALALLLRIGMVCLASPVVAERWIIRTLPFRMDGLLLGGVLALLLRGERAAVWQARCKGIFLAGLVAVLNIFVVTPAYDAPLLLTAGLTMTAVASAGLIGMVLPAESMAGRLFSLPPLRRLGKYSYGFYIYHVLFGFAWIAFLVALEQRLHSVAVAGVVAIATNFTVTYLVARLSYEQYEVRFLRLKPRFDYDLETARHQHADVSR
ncbi:MAG: acyltransferase [Acidobacteriota bacterium]|nr:acyltransferase [Acidobacteriota bacterium]